MRVLTRFLMALGLLGLLLVGVGTTAATAAPGDNVVPAQTSDVEGTGTGLWQAWYGDTITRSTAQANTGTASLAVAATGADVGITWSNWPGVTGIQPNTQYALSFAVRGPAGATFTAEYQWFNGSTSLRTDYVTDTTNGGWVHPTQQVTTPANANTLFVNVVSANASGGATYYLDTIQAVQGGGGCTNPVWTDTANDNQNNTDMYTDGSYIMDMDMWNAAGYNITQTMNVCNHASWYVDDTVPESTDTAVKVYPDVHEDFINWSTGAMPAISSFNTISSSYAGQGSGVGSYDVAYDIWLNGVATAGSNEVMIWTEAQVQTPAGFAPKIASNVALAGHSWDVYAMTNNSYIAFVPTNGQSYPSGTLDLKAFFTWLMQNGNISGTSKLGAIDYGVEVVATGGGDARFTCTNFSITAN